MLRIMSVRMRLTTVFALVLGIMITLIAVSCVGLNAQQNSAASVTRTSSLARRALEVKYQLGEWNGWRTGYAFDIARGVPGATDDTTGNSRKSFIQAAARLQTAINDLRESPGLTARQRDAIDKVGAAVLESQSTDANVISAYRAGTPTDIAAANDLVMGKQLRDYQAVTSAVEAMVNEFTAEEDRAARKGSEDAANSQRMMLALGAFALLLMAFLAPVLVRSITRPLTELRTRLVDIAEGDGDLTARIVDSGRDELAGVAHAFNKFSGKIQDMVRLMAETAATLSGSVDDLSASSAQLVHGAEKTSTQTESVSTSAEEVSRNVHTVATGVEEMGASIREIAMSASHAAAVAQEAVDFAGTASAAIEELGHSSEEIIQVVDLITSITEQTNLLAINATIEAAHVGEAGKGFTVVASGIKDLAMETAQATGHIGAQIEAIRRDVTAAVESVSRISTVIGRIDSDSASIASAVEQQTATAHEIARNISEAALESSSIAGHITGVAETATDASQAACQASAATGVVAEVITALTATVNRFRY